MQKGHRIILLVALLFVCQQIKSQRTIYVGGDILLLHKDSIIDNGYLITQGGRIEEMGYLTGLKPHPGDRVIKVKGKYILPGLIDAHIHFFQSGGLYTRPDILDLTSIKPYSAELQEVKSMERIDDVFSRYLQSGITGVVDCGGPYWNFDIRDRADASANAPRVAVAGPLISTYHPPRLDENDPPIIKVDNANQALKEVRSQLLRKPDFIKIWYIVRKGEKAEDHLPIIKAVIDTAHAAGVRVAVHATELETARLAVQNGADILVHSVFDKEVDQSFIDLLKSQRVIYIPTISVMENYGETFSGNVSLTKTERRLSDPEVLRSLYDFDEVPKDLIASRFNPNQNVSPSDIAMKNLKKLSEAGVIIAAGTDAGNIGTPHGPAMSREFEIMLEAGLSNAEILLSATRGGSLVMKEIPGFGLMELGKEANFLILNKNPLDDLNSCFDPYKVIRHGKTMKFERKDEKVLAPVEGQLQAYNNRNIEEYLKHFSDTCKVYYHESAEVVMDGKSAMREPYSSMFDKYPNLHCTIIKRIVNGNHVIDHERITGVRAVPFTAVAIYEVKDQLIQKVWFIR